MKTNTVRAALRPRLWIVAGPNGSGKSSAYDRSDVDEFGGSVWIINPDLLTQRIMSAEKLALQPANLAAVERIQAWLESSIAVHQTIGVETVLSTPKFRRLVEKAKAVGFEVRLIYVYLRSAELQLDRIRLRVLKGGHDVPETKVRERRTRSFEQAGWFFQAADEAWIFDNSTSEPELVGRKRPDKISLSAKIPVELMQSLLHPHD
jgi:predicted ABC-type ATPase